MISIMVKIIITMTKTDKYIMIIITTKTDKYSNRDSENTTNNYTLNPMPETRMAPQK